MENIVLYLVIAHASHESALLDIQFLLVQLNALLGVGDACEGLALLG